MAKPVETVARRHTIAGATGNAPQMLGGPRGIFADVLFLQCPRRLDRIEIGRVGGR